MQKEKVPFANLLPNGEFNDGESHGIELVKKSPTKQTQAY